MNKEEKKYWMNYYNDNSKPGSQSLFAEFVQPFIKDNSSMIELGCGNGRDALYFSKNASLEYCAVDQCQNEVDFLNKYSDGQPNLKFIADDFTNLKSKEKVDYVYSRFTLHSVNNEGELNALKWVAEHLKDNGLFFIEVRSIKDDLYGEGTKIGHHEFVTDHYRRFVEMDQMITNGKNAGLSLLYSIQAKGFAPYKEKNPEVIRIIFQKS